MRSTLFSNPTEQTAQVGGPHTISEIPCREGIPDLVCGNYFNSINTARAFLLQVACASDAQKATMPDKIAEAKRIVAKANKRNEKRRERRARKAGGRPARRPVAEKEQPSRFGPLEMFAPSRHMPGPAEKPVEKPPVAEIAVAPIAGSTELSPNWERTLDSDGNIFYRKIFQSGNKFIIRKDKGQPKEGDVVIDMTAEPRAYIIQHGAEVPVAITRKMKDCYRNMVIHKAREYESGKISLHDLAKHINAMAASYAAARQSKKSLKRKKKK